MKLRKRILSLVLAVMLVVAMAVSASAQTVQTSGSYDGCTYAISANAASDYYYTVIEYQNSYPEDYTNYIFQASIVTTELLNDGTSFSNRLNGRAAYRISRVDNNAFGTLQYMECYYRINSNPVSSPLLVRAG